MKTFIWQLLSLVLFFLVFLNGSEEATAQNIGISTDGSTPEAGVMLDVKGINSYATTATQNIFQIQSFDASTTALKMRLGLSTGASLYGRVDVFDASSGINRALSLQPSGGNVGIGTTAPSSKLDVFQTNQTLANIQTTLGAHNILIQSTLGAGAVFSPGLAWYTNDDNATKPKAGIWEFNSAIGSRLYFGTTNSYTSGINNTAMIIDKDANVGIGVFPDHRLTVQVPASTTPGDSLFGMNVTDGTRFMYFLPGTVGTLSYNNIMVAYDQAIVYNQANGFVICPWGPGSSGIRMNGSGQVGIGKNNPAYTLDISGTAYCNGVAWASDFRKKKNIQTLDVSGLEIISKLHPVTFEWKEVRDDGMKGTQIGFIAQELERILPTMVVTANDSAQSKGVKYNEMLPILVKAIQEQQKIIVKQQSDIEAMKMENQQIKATMNADINTLKTAVRILLKQNILSATK